MTAFPGPRLAGREKALLSLFSTELKGFVRACVRARALLHRSRARQSNGLCFSKIILPCYAVVRSHTRSAHEQCVNQESSSVPQARALWRALFMHWDERSHRAKQSLFISLSIVQGGKNYFCSSLVSRLAAFLKQCQVTSVLLLRNI